MATNSRLVRALQFQRIANTSRKLAPTTSTASTTTPHTPTLLKSLPEHKSLLPLLLSHDIPSKVARACADRFDRSANQLRSETEAKLVPYLINRRKNQPARVYSFFLNSYSHTLHDWAQSILNAALRSLKRDPTKIQDWDVMYPPPLWLPSPLDPRAAFTHGCCQTSSSLLPISTPTHAFPTTYPPPLRPPSGVPPVEWPRTLVASSGSPSTPTVDLDSLCIRFANSLVIDENPVRPVRPKASIFSLPDNFKDGSGVSSLRTRRPKSKAPPAPTFQKSTNPMSTTSPRRAVKPRQLSMPPSFPQITPKVRPTSRKPSAPVIRPSPTSSAVSSTPSDSPPSLPSRISPPLTPLMGLTSGLDTGSHLSLTIPHPVSPQLPFDLGIRSTTLTTQDSPCSSSGPTTPPSLSSDLFSEPTIISPTSVQLSEPFPTTQFQPQSDFFSHTFLGSFDDAGSLFHLPPGGFFLKNSFDIDSIMGYPQTSITSESLMGGVFYS